MNKSAKKCRRTLLALILISAVPCHGEATFTDAVECDRTAIRIATRGEALWDYTVRGTGWRFPIAPPVVSLDGKEVTLRLAGVKSAGAPVTLPNGCREYAFGGPVDGEEGLNLRLVFRVADGDPVVRFRYEIESSRARHLTKPAGKDALTYLGVSLAGLPEASELRLSDWNGEYHCNLPLELPLDEQSFADGEQAIGPILMAGDASRQLLVAYEHGGLWGNNSFLRYRLAPDRTVRLEAVRGNYWDGEEIGLGKTYKTIWFELAVIKGNRDRLAGEYRAFVLRHLAVSPAARRPQIFYNTWNFQERNCFWNKKSFLADMTLDRMLREIDVAHRMGIDVFVLDTGWYEKAGDWQVNLKRFPDGMKQIKAKLDGYGMKLGLWFAPPAAALSSEMLKKHQDCVVTRGGKQPEPHEIWGTEKSVDCCMVSRFGPDFADKLIQLNRELGVTYFKWDAVQQEGECDDPGHGHGTAANSARERQDCFAFQLPQALTEIAERVSEAVPDAICDLDMTEGGRCFGLEYLSAGKFFVMNNGPYYNDYNLPLPPDKYSNIFVRPCAARGWICRAPLAYDRWIPSTLLLTHFLPDDPEASQIMNIGSLVLGQDGIWGDLLGVSDAGVARFGLILGKYKEVRDDMAAAAPEHRGQLGGAEVYEKLAPNGRGGVVLFGGAILYGSNRYITCRPAERRVWHTAGVRVTFDKEGRAIIDAISGETNIVFFGVN
jgi:alpha-galactosidase